MSARTELLQRDLPERSALRLALPSKGRMAEDTLQLLKVRTPPESPDALMIGHSGPQPGVGLAPQRHQQP